MGGSGSGLAYNEEDLHRIAGSGLALSPTTEVLLEESILGWKEYELEVMRDTADNVVIVCSIENFDPMGVHTGDSITVAPAMTLTDVEYQRLRDISIGIIREVGVDTGGCNIQFAVNPDDGRIVVIEMNPRVSRSSALASKATGFPIAKIAAKVAIGYTLDEIPNDITQVTPASFEPTLDYVVVKVPRFAFEKFPNADATLTTHMKSVGEAMAIGRNFTEALQKALRSLERPDSVFDWNQKWVDLDKASLLDEIAIPHDGRIKKVMDAIRAGATPQEIFEATKIDPWFVDQLALINEIAVELIDAKELSPGAAAQGQASRLLRRPDRQDPRTARGRRTRRAPRARCAPGLQDRRHLCGRVRRHDALSLLVIRRGDRGRAAYQGSRADPRQRPQPHRPGHRVRLLVRARCAGAVRGRLRDDHGQLQPRDRLDRLRHLRSPLLRAADARGRARGRPRRAAGRPGCRRHRAARWSDTARPRRRTRSRRRADRRYAARRDRPRRGARRVRPVLADAGLPAPKHGMATTFSNARKIAAEIGYPVLVRPSYVLGGRGMEIVYDEGTLKDYIDRATEISPERPVLVDRFLDDAIEIDVDALYDGNELFLGGVMEHIEEAGVHSGDSACALPPITLGGLEIQRIRESTEAIAKGVGVRGLINIQFALSSDILYVIEANPRASRTVPFVSKATATPLAKAAARLMLGESIADLRKAGVLPADGDGGDLPDSAPIAVKEAVMPFNRFRTYEGKYVDTLLGPEMRSTGEVMGMDHAFGTAFAKSQAGAQNGLPTSGKVFVSVANRDKRHMIFPVKRLADLGFEILATSGTAVVLARNGVHATVIRKLNEDPLPGETRITIVEKIHEQDVQLIINTPHGVTAGGNARIDGYEIRTAAVAEGIPCITTVQGLAAAVQGIEALIEGKIGVTSLQEWGQIVAAGQAGRERVMSSRIGMSARAAMAAYGPACVGIDPHCVSCSPSGTCPTRSRDSIGSPASASRRSPDTSRS